MFDLAALHVDLQGQEQGEGHLVLLVETACSVLVNLERHVLDNVHDSFGRDRRLLRSVWMRREIQRYRSSFSLKGFDFYYISRVNCKISGISQQSLPLY